MTSTSDLSLLAARFARLTAARRRVFMTKLAAADIDFRLLPIPAHAAPRPVSPASYGQTRIWLHARIIDEPAAYHIAVRLSLDGSLDRAALRRAFDTLVARHEALRTSFVEAADGGVEQRVEPPMGCRWRETDLSRLPSSSDEAPPKLAPAEPAAPLEKPTRSDAVRMAERIARTDEAEPFDLACAPLLRAHLITLAPAAHWLVVTLHHIVADGWSIDVALSELAVLYGAYLQADAGTPLAQIAQMLPPLPIQYPDYTQWQRQWLEAGEAERQLAFWRSRLDARTGAISLPGSRALPRRRSALGARHHFVLDAGLGERVRSFAEARRATPFAVLLAALHALLARATGERHLQIGVPAANRARPEVAGVIGCLVNTVVVPARVEPRRRFDTLVDEVQAALIDAQSYEDVPFEQVVDALGAGRSPTHHPIFQVMATYAGAQALPRFGDARAAMLPTALCYAKVDLAFGFEARGDGALDAAMVYAQDIFDECEIARLAGRYRQCLASALSAPGSALAELEWLTEDDRRELADCIPPRVMHEQFLETIVPIHERIAALAAASPHASAVGDSTRMLTRGELERRANEVAQCLTEAGVGPHMHVGIALGRGVELFVALLAILKTGAAFVPLDPAHPRERLTHVIEDAGIDYVVTERAHVAKLPLRPRTRIWLMDGETTEPALPAPSAVSTARMSPTQAAYLIYTSGSTGKPKGVVVEHGALAMHCEAIAARYGMCENDRVLHVASINFDGAHECWMAPLLAGAHVHITGDTLNTPEAMSEAMARESITVAAFTPSYALQMAQWALRHGASRSLRSLTVGGEATSHEAFLTLREAFPGVRIVNGYGPTETVITPLVWMSGDERAQAIQALAYLPIGTPVGARTAHVLDAQMQPLPIGAIGELYLGGVGLARGYHARAGLTAERFLPDPYGRPGSRLYRTGDLVRRRARGVLEFVGRADHQVKLRGLRIELGEIESRLIAHPCVRDSISLVRGTGPDAALLAYVEFADSVPAPSGDALKAHLRRVLPEYMVPSRIIVLEHLPRNTNGKVERAALPEPGPLERVFEAPMPGVETALANIWCDVLRVGQVSRTDDFFNIGGHSLKAAAVAARVAERLGREVPMRALFEAPTLAGYAQCVRETPPRSSKPARAEPESAREQRGIAVRLGDEPSLPSASAAHSDIAALGARFSGAQDCLWFLWRAPPATASHHIAVALRCSGALEVGALASALDALARRYDALRTGIVDGAPPRLCVSSRSQVCVPLVDLSAHDDAAARLEQARQLTDEDALRPFAMTGEPLWRVRLLRLADDDHVLSLVIHHAVVDGQSMSIGLDRLRRFYMSACAARTGPACLPVCEQGETSPVSALQDVNNATDARHADYWQTALRDAPPLPLPKPLTRPTGEPAEVVSPAPSWDASRIELAFDPLVVERARKCAQSVQATLPMLMHAALNIALARELGVFDQPVGTLASFRGGALQEEMGLFIQTLVVRTRMTPRASLLDVLKSVRDATWSAYEHIGTPLTHVLGTARAPNGDGHPLLAALFNYVQIDPAQAYWGALRVAPFNDARRRVLFELELDIVEDAQGRLVGALSFAHERVESSFARRLARRCCEAVAQLGASPNEWVAPLPPVCNVSKTAERRNDAGTRSRSDEMEVR